jgi:epoxyqueuosine reductase QueG
MDKTIRAYEEIKGIALQNGATVCGVGKVDHLLESFPDLSPALRSGMKYAISVGIRLSDRILDDIEDGPTQLYYLHYRRVNHSLDHIGIVLTNFIQSQGFSALPIHASQTIDWENQRGLLSHKVMGRQSGHGWIGRNNLLVHPSYGASIRYMTVLTDMPLPSDKPLTEDCGECRKCIEACPAGAISESFDTWDRDACLEQLKTFSKMRHIRHYICGICVRVCRPRHGDPGTHKTV